MTDLRAGARRDHGLGVVALALILRAMDLSTVANLADVAGAAGGVVAIFFGIRALLETSDVRGDAIDERRRLFELEILREILREVDDGLLFEIGGEPRRLRRFTFRLGFLPTSEMPTWREMLGMNWQDEVSERFEFKEPWHAKSREVGEAAKRGEDNSRLQTELHQVAFNFHETVSSQLMRELSGAITARVEAGRFQGSRRAWYGKRRRRPGDPAS